MFLHSLGLQIHKLLSLSLIPFGEWVKITWIGTSNSSAGIGGNHSSTLQEIVQIPPYFAWNVTYCYRPNFNPGQTNVIWGRPIKDQ